jgi:hypothetical protein
LSPETKQLQKEVLAQLDSFKFSHENKSLFLWFQLKAHRFSRSLTSRFFMSENQVDVAHVDQGVGGKG